MITYENTKTICDLVQNAGREHGERVFLRYEDNDVVYDVTYRQFVEECSAISAWTKEQDAVIGHRAQVDSWEAAAITILQSCLESWRTEIPSFRWISSWM